MLNQHEKEIIEKELKINGIKSVVLIGSRSTGNFIRAESDYDLYAITSTWAVPFLYFNIKRKEQILKEKLASEVSLEPLTMWRLKHGMDLLLFKTKDEGTTVFGNDYLSLINCMHIGELSADEYFSFFFSSIYFLVMSIDSIVNRLEINEKGIHNVAKSIMYCVELQLFIRGIYEKNEAKIIARFSKELKPKTEILNVVHSARKILLGANLSVEDFDKLWISAKKYIVVVFQQLADRFLFSKNESLSNLIEEYKVLNFSFKKNFQYFLLCRIKNQRTYFINILKRKSIEKHFQCALFYLMLSLNDDMSINNEFLEKVYDTLSSIHLLNSYSTYDDFSSYALWHKAKQIILENWLMALGRSIV